MYVRFPEEMIYGSSRFRFVEMAAAVTVTFCRLDTLTTFRLGSPLLNVFVPKRTASKIDVEST